MLCLIFDAAKTIRLLDFNEVITSSQSRARNLYVEYIRRQKETIKLKLRIIGSVKLILVHVNMQNVNSDMHAQAD